VCRYAHGSCSPQWQLMECILGCQEPRTQRQVLKCCQIVTSDTLHSEAGVEHGDSVALHESYIDEYNELSDEEKDELVEQHRQIKDCNKNFRHPSAKGRIEDVNNTVRNIKRLVSHSFLLSFLELIIF
jgi:hypothetical protein